jgi:putative transposase
MTGKVTLRVIADAAGKTKRTIERRAEREQWPFDEETTRGGTRRVYDKAHLPDDIKAKLVLREAAAGTAIGRGMAIATAVESRIGKRTAEANLLELTKLTGGKRQRAEAILNILGALDKFIDLAQLPLSTAINKFCLAYNDGDHQKLDDSTTALFPTIAPGTVTRWRRQLQHEGVRRLGGNYGNRKGASKIEAQPELLKFCLAMVTEFPDANATSMMKGIKARFSKRAIAYPSTRALQRWLNGWKAEHKQLLTAIANPDGWKNKYMTAFGSASEGVERLNQLWEADGTPADVMLTDGRYAIIGVIDVYSRRTLLHVVRTQKASAVAAMLRRALLEWGVWETLKTDNGSDYTSHHIRRVVELLHLNQEFSAPFSGWQKPHIERVFRTFAHDLVELLPNYIGHNVAERERIRARQSFAERLFKKDDAPEINMTAAELQAFCDRWVNDVYMHQEHSGLGGMTPFEKASSYTGEVRRIENPRALDILLSETEGDGVRTVTKKGIRIKPGTFIAPELGEWVGSEVRCLKDATDLGRIYVFTLDNEFICIAEDPSLTGVSRQEVSAVARARQKVRVQEARKKLKQAAREEDVKEIATEIQDYKAERRKSLTQFPHKGVAHTSAGLTAAEQAVAMLDASKQPKEQPPVDAAALAEVQQLLRDEQVEREPEEKRFRRWWDLQQRKAAGGETNEFDAAWLKSYEQTEEFSARKMLLDDFGPEGMGLEVMTA